MIIGDPQEPPDVPHCDDRRLSSVYAAALSFAHRHNQVIGEKNEYFITLAQLERLMCEYLEQD